MKTAMKQFFGLSLLLLLIGKESSAQTNTQLKEWQMMGDQFYKNQQYDSALKYLNKGYMGAIKAKDKKAQASFCKTIGYCLFEKPGADDAENKEKANWYLNNSLGFYRELKDTVDQSAIRKYQSKQNVSSFDRLRYGGIEIGAKGIKFTILDFTLGKNGSFEHVFTRDSALDPQIIDFTDSAILKSIGDISQWYDTLINNRIDTNKIFIAISSGVRQEARRKWGAEEGDKRLSDFKNRVSAKISAKLGLDIKTLSTCEEVDYTIKGILNKEDRGEVSLVDIGSGNTKGGTFRHGKFDAASCIDISWGSASFGKLIKGKDAESAKQIFNEKVRPEMDAQFKAHKGITKDRSTFLFTGGAYWIMANYLHPEQFSLGATVFTTKDVYRFYELAANDYDKLTHPDLSKVPDRDLKKVQKEINKSIEKFNPEQTLAAALIMKAIVDKMNPIGDGNIEMDFIRYGYVGWLAGYIHEQVDSLELGIHNSK